MRWLAVVLVAVMIVGLTWWKVSSRHVVEQQAGSSEFSVAQLPADASEVRLHSPQGGVAPDFTPPDSGAGSKDLHESGKKQAAQVAVAGHNKLLSQYQSEKVDAHWAHEREQSLVSHSVSPQIEDLKVEPKNMTVHCRSSTCAIGADFATRGAADDWLVLYATNTGTNLSSISSQVSANADGSAHIQIYGLAK